MAQRKTALRSVEELPDEGVLPSGHRVLVQLSSGREEVLVQAPDGEVQLRIELTDKGPVVKLSAARLELDAAETVAVRCARFEVEATEGARVATQGQLDLASGKEMHLTADEDLKAVSPMIWLN